MEGRCYGATVLRCYVCPQNSKCGSGIAHCALYFFEDAKEITSPIVKLSIWKFRESIIFHRKYDVANSDVKLLADICLGNERLFKLNLAITRIATISTKVSVAASHATKRRIRNYLLAEDFHILSVKTAPKKYLFVIHNHRNILTDQTAALNQLVRNVKMKCIQ